MITASTSNQILELVLWENRDLPKSEKNDKGEWIKTSEKEVFTFYTFRDEFGDVIKFLKKGTDYRHLQGKQVEVIVNLAYDNYNNVTKLTLGQVIELAD